MGGNTLGGSTGVTTRVDVVRVWRRRLSLCPYCAAAGPCVACDGTGDLFAVLLGEAYEEGRQDVLRGLEQVQEVRALAVDRMRRERRSPAELAARIVGEAA